MLFSSFLCASAALTPTYHAGEQLLLLLLLL